MMFRTRTRRFAALIAAAVTFTTLVPGLPASADASPNPMEGIVLTKHERLGPEGFGTISYEDGIFYLTGKNNRAYSDDGGSSWKKLYGNNAQMDTAGDGNGNFLTVVGSGGYIRWDTTTRALESFEKTIYYPGFKPSMPSVAYFKGSFYAAGYETATMPQLGRIFKLNDDGESWEHIAVQGPALENKRFNKIRTNGTTMVAVGEYGLIATSTDGVTWTQRESGSSQHLVDVTVPADGSPIMAVGMYNTITISEDGGETWQAYGFKYDDPDIYSVTYARGYYVISNEYGKILYSTDARNWSEFNHGFGRIGINAINIDLPGQMVLVSGGGLVYSVSKATTSTALASSANPASVEQEVVFTATVSKPSNSPVTAAPTGTVTFKNGESVLGSAPLTVGQATYSVSDLSIGTHQITAVYSGDGAFGTSASAPLGQVVTDAVPKKSTTTTVTSTRNPSTVGQSVTIHATVTGPSGTPTGTLTFKDGDTVLDAVPMTVGAATYSTTQFMVGVHPITVTYSGDVQFEGSTSATLHQTVNADDSGNCDNGSGGSSGGSDGGSSGGSGGGSDPTTGTTPTAQPTTPEQPDAQKPEGNGEIPQDPNDIFRSQVVRADSNVIAGVQARTAEILENGGQFASIQYNDLGDHWSIPNVEKLTKLGVIHGYPTGGFEPDAVITRAEFAAMIDRGFVDMASRKVEINEEDFAAFSDIEGHWSSDNLKQLVAVGVMTGYEDGTIRPEKLITRQEMALMITRVLNAYILNRDTSDVAFSDLDGAYGAEAIKKATALGIFTGKTKQRFDPHAGATRAESLQTIINTYTLSPAIKEALDSLS
ncbi:Ig-like domain repeat protein [Paenibacillus sp. M-152]|uniref:Ig-like domain repeat protein n=1 Tax=Paenibacillus sp. M-152 TaxID=2487928 RepID=UPI000F6B5260|nr:Ig-like domain repeat protein [Paenibacillus sp. M-152]AZH29610.1 peptidase M28 [Paenibacillus sp. M-152]